LSNGYNVSFLNISVQNIFTWQNHMNLDFSVAIHKRESWCIMWTNHNNSMCFDFDKDLINFMQFERTIMVNHGSQACFSKFKFSSHVVKNIMKVWKPIQKYLERMVRVINLAILYANISHNF
jgi:hypothetical protein